MKRGAKLWGRLTIERTKKGLTQYELARKARVGRAIITHAETGRSVPREGVVLRLAYVLGVSTDYLLGT